MTHAATIMGVTVVGGAITTFISALFMLACQLTFFGSMCTLIGGTIMFSLTYSLFFFMPLMALAGPSGETPTLTLTLAPHPSPSPLTLTPTLTPTFTLTHTHTLTQVR